MKKNPLSEIYTSKVLVSESVPSNVVKKAKPLEDEMNLKKATTVPGQGPEACKKDLETPKEMHGTEVHEPQVLKDSMENEETKSYEGAFEKLFKATINEEEMIDDPSMEMDVTVPTSDEEMADEIEGTNDEVTDLVSDLQDLMSKLQSILDKVGEETSSEVTDEVETELGGEEEVDAEESPFEEAVDLKPLGDKGKVLMGKNNKVGGHPKVHGGKAHGGDIGSDPKLKPAKSYDKALQSPKGKPEVKSTVKKGDFFK
jgi:hypothetical protein